MKQHNLHTGILRKKIYIFLAGAVVLVLAFSLVAGYQQDYFSRMTTLYFFSDNATGIKPGMIVRILGFNIGEVTDIALEPNAKVRVKMSVKSDHMRFITLDSRARLFKEGMIGDSVIEISPGSQKLRPLAHNAVLPFNRGRDLTEIADELYGEIQPILKEAGKTMASVNDPNGDIQQSLHRIQPILKEAGKTMTTASKTMAAIGETVAGVNNPEGDIQQTLRQVNQATESLRSLSANLATQTPPLLGKADNIARTVDQKLPELFENAKLSLDNIHDATGDLKQITSTSAQELPQTLHDGQALVKGSLTIVNGVKEAWPVRNMISPPREQALAPDSYVPAAR